MSRFRAIGVAGSLTCLAAGGASAQYRVFDFNGAQYTDVIINHVPQPLADVRAFEFRCRTRAVSGNWWIDGSGNLGLAGNPASFNTRTCQAPGRGVSTARRGGGSCHFFGTSGSICSW